MRSSLALLFLAIVALPTPALALDDTIRGATVSGSFGTSAAGDTLMGEVGGEWAGLRVFHGRWLLQWDTLLAVQGGYLGNEHPFLFLVGPHASSWVEGGYRFTDGRRFSPYVGLRLSGEAKYLGNPDVALRDVNSVDGVGGPYARGALRVSAGNALVDSVRALLITLFVQEAADGPELHTASRVFTEGGASIRWDVARSWMSSLEGYCGTTFGSTDPLLGTTVSTLRCGASAMVRKIFSNGMWIGASASVEHDRDDLSYTGGLTYETSSPPVFGVALWYGLPLWRAR